MSKRLIFILALVFVASMVAGAYAEVQNVKVSGDILMRAISRKNFTLSKDTKYDTAGFTTTTRVRVDADLTDNVSTTVRLLNERSWGLENNWNAAGVADTDKNTAIDVDLAYVTLKEFLYSPLTLTIGRQELKFGNGLIIGDPDTVLYADETYIPMDLSSRKAFDAIRATLNYDPLIIDLVYAKIDETDGAWWQQAGLTENNDTNLWGVNALYNLGMNNATAEVYYWKRVNKDKDATTVLSPEMLSKNDTCNTFGFLVQGEVLPKTLKASVEYARQYGTETTYLGNNIGYNAKRRAWATQAMLTYLYQDQPALGAIYTYLSGDNDVFAGKAKGWDPMFTGQIGNNVVSAILPASDVQIINLWGGMKPSEDVTISLVYGYYRLVKEMQDLANGTLLPDYIRLLGTTPYAASLGNSYSMTGKKSLGNAIDLTATYDYTEDVQFGLTFGMMFLGDAFRKDTGAVSGLFGVAANKENPRQLIGSMKVTF
ncbi:MAG: alginate export family protein [Candidatus Omnitrophica bacterium]|nr:alginate export family protein [Candidatus Omnitrophota bacterium]MDD5654797.1 alginate export family protein [Candidatus Omnitrophota bacterium]